MDTHGAMEPAGQEAATRRRFRWGLGVFLVIAAYFLLTEHRAHVIAALPWLLLLGCPLMHLFMHRGHGSHQQEQAAGTDQKKDERQGKHEHAGHGCC